ncbi:MAG: YdcF family protein [Myxococcaceae bacterium]|nr:YdcF family protein [Myxococcaceae bacterium]
MFLVLSKMLDLFLAPLTWVLLLLLAAAFLVRRGPGLARGLLVTGVAVLFLASTRPVACALVGWAEAGAVRTLRPDVVYDAVIVLGGGLEPVAAEETGEPEFNDSPERVLRGFELVRSGRARNVLLSAGSLDPRPEAVVEAEVLGRMLEAWGVPRERIVLEGRSRNTRENAVESARVVRERGWQRVVLVTSAMHMPRALGCFRAVGLSPDALPVDFHAHRPGPAGGWIPRAEFLELSTDALRELAGRVVYQVLGYSR